MAPWARDYVAASPHTPGKDRGARAGRFLTSHSEVRLLRNEMRLRGQKRGAGIMRRLEFALTAALIFGVILGSVRLVERQHRSHAAVSASPSVVAFNR